MNAASPAPSADDRSERPADGGAPGDTADSSARPSVVGADQECSVEGEGIAFGTAKPTRFGADVEYRGGVGSHDYLLRVRHRLLDTSFTVVVDGVEHDPVAEEKAHKAAGEEGEAASVESEGALAQADEEPELSGQDVVVPDAARTVRAGGDDLRFRTEDGFATLHCTIRRPRETGEYEDCEVITIRTAGLGGAGEVEIRHSFRTTVLIPAEGSPSALRDERRTAHPTRYALVAALTKGAKFLIPLLGLGALFSGLLDPVKQWVEQRIRPAVDAIVQATQPIRDWIEEVTRPVREFFDALLSPVRELIAAILRPIGEALRWLLGLLPDIGLPFDVPGWLVDVLVPVLVVVAVFAATYSGLRKRREKLAETEAESARGASTSLNAGEGGTDGASTATAERTEVAVEDEASERDDQAAKGTSSTPEEPAAQDGSSDRGDTEGRA